MPRLKNRPPRYRQHKSSGQAVVTIAGHEHYLGRHGTAASQRRYQALLAEELATGSVTDRAELTIVELVAYAWRYAKTVLP